MFLLQKILISLRCHAAWNCAVVYLSPEVDLFNGETVDYATSRSSLFMISNAYGLREVRKRTWGSHRHVEPNAGRASCS